jgi:hypothetical protein
VATHPSAPRRRLPTSPFKDEIPPPLEVYEVDDRVSHDSFGMGRVVSIGTDGSVVVDFGPRRELIAMPYPKLHKL